MTVVLKVFSDVMFSLPHSFSLYLFKSSVINLF